VKSLEKSLLEKRNDDPLLFSFSENKDVNHLKSEYLAYKDQ